MLTVRYAVFTATLLLVPFAPQALVAQEPEGPDTVRYEVPRGAVMFAHREHAKGSECVTCHHESKPEKPAKVGADGKQVVEKCSACHTSPASDPMKTTLRKAYHDTANKTGVCIDCHKKETEAGKKAPVACGDCHIKAAN